MSAYQQYPFMFEQTHFTPTTCHFGLDGRYVCSTVQPKTKPNSTSKSQSYVQQRESFNAQGISPSPFETVVQYRDQMMLDNNEDVNLFHYVKPSTTSMHSDPSTKNGFPLWTSYNTLNQHRVLSEQFINGGGACAPTGAFENERTVPMDLDSIYAPPTPAAACKKRKMEVATPVGLAPDACSWGLLS